MRSTACALILGLLATLTSSRPQQQQLSTVQQIIARNLAQTPFRIGIGMNQFGNRLFGAVSRSESGNIVLSPFSLHTALSMTFFGSPERSETHLELSQLLGMPPQFYRWVNRIEMMITSNAKDILVIKYNILNVTPMRMALSLESLEFGWTRI